MADLFVAIFYAVIALALCAASTYLAERVFGPDSNRKSEMEDELDDLARLVDQEIKNKTNRTGNKNEF